MASAMRVFRKFRASDGRIKIATLSGVSALVAVIALLVGVLPVFATDNSPGETDQGVHPEEIRYGGGPGACDAVDSDARFELHINLPANETFTAPDGTKVKITLSETDPRIFGYEFVGDGGAPAVMAAYDVVVNGGPHNMWYDNDGQVGPLQSDGNLHAPRKNNGDLNNLSHVNICYDVQPVSFVCGTPSDALNFGDGSFEGATATIFANSLFGCTDKDGFFFIDGDTATLDFGSTGTVAGRADFTKDFGDPALFEDLTYDGPGEFVELQWCEIRDAAEDGTDLVVLEGEGDPVNPFATWLPDGKYPSLVGVTDTLDNGTPNDTSDDTTVQATACKVAEIENAAGEQVSVAYFEFEDPNFR